MNLRVKYIRNTYTGLSLCFHLDKAEKKGLRKVAAFYVQQQQLECQYEARPKRQSEVSIKCAGAEFQVSTMLFVFV